MDFILEIRSNLENYIIDKQKLSGNLDACKLNVNLKDKNVLNLPQFSFISSNKKY